MTVAASPSWFAIWFRELRAKFFAASVTPVFVGAAAAYAASGKFDLFIFSLTVLGMLLLHAGANVSNDYFDHVSGNDTANPKDSPFSGGSRVIQQGLLTPRAVLTGALIFFALGAVVGLYLAWYTHSLFILALVLIGLFGGFFYTAPPLRLGYSTLGALANGLCFGPLPAYGAYYLQTRSLDGIVLVPGLLCGILLALVLLVNGFPDELADRRANKRTVVVTLGVRAAAYVFHWTLLGTYLLALIGAFFWRATLPAAAAYLLTLPLTVVTLRYLDQDIPDHPDSYRVNRSMLQMHLLGSAALAVGLVVAGLIHR
jgi:1,4-dihydroxy-2-naphthoate octaprenyltransferase